MLQGLKPVASRDPHFNYFLKPLFKIEAKNYDFLFVFAKNAVISFLT